MEDSNSKQEDVSNKKDDDTDGEMPELEDAGDDDFWIDSTGCKMSWTSKALSVCTCPPGETECMVRAHLDCPFEDPMHYNCSDGCPSCLMAEIDAKNAREM